MKHNNEDRPEVSVPGLWLQVSKITQYLRENVWPKKKEAKSEGSDVLPNTEKQNTEGDRR
jgi:hypothetical protein